MDFMKEKHGTKCHSQSKQLQRRRNVKLKPNLLAVSWQCAVSGNNCLPSPNSCTVQPMKWKAENIITLTRRQSWWTAALSYSETTKETQPLEQADAGQPLPWSPSKAPHYEDVSFYSLCTTTEVVVWPQQQAGQQEDKEKVITNIYLQQHVRAL